MPETSPSAPSGLSGGALRLWHAIVDVYELDEHERVLLVQACRTVDLLDALERTLKRDGAVVDDGKGGRRVHPAAPELRQQRIALARLLAAMRLPDEDDEAVGRREQRRSGARGVYGIVS